MTEKNKVVNIHLADIVKASYVEKEVYTELMVSSTGESFHVPKVLEIKCLLAGGCEVGKGCPWENGEPRSMNIPEKNSILIDFTRTPSKQLDKIILKDLLYCRLPLKNRHFQIKVTEYKEVQEILAIPKVKKVTTAADKTQVDESGHEYKERLIYYLGSL